MLFFDGACHYDYLVRAARRESKSPLRSAYVGHCSKRRAESPDFDSQPSAMRLIGELQPERARDESVSRNVSRPRFT
jgi:hypothetical protein